MPTTIELRISKPVNILLAFLAGYSAKIIVKDLLDRLPSFVRSIHAPEEWVVELENRLKQLPAEITREQFETIVYNINDVLPDVQDWLANLENRVRKLEQQAGHSNCSSATKPRSSFVPVSQIPHNSPRPTWAVVFAGIILSTMCIGFLYFVILRPNDSPANSGNFDERRFDLKIKEAEENKQREFETAK